MSISDLSISDLLFVGFNGYVVALHRDTGDIIWSNNKLQGGYVTLLVDGDRLIVSTNGYMYCLEPLSGEILWNNPLTGYGVGPASLASVRGSPTYSLPHQAEADRRSRDNV